MKPATEYQNIHLLEVRKSHAIWMLAQAIQCLTQASIESPYEFSRALQCAQDAWRSIVKITNDEPVETLRCP